MAIELIDKIKPKNGGSFPMVDAGDVLMPNGQRLNDYAEATASKEYVQTYVQENTPSVPEGVATETYVQNYVNEFATENLQGIATKTYVQDYVDEKLGEEEAELPAVTAADNGKFLRVVDGAWAPAALQDVSEVGL